MTAFIFKPKRRRGGKLRTSSTWWLRFARDGEKLQSICLGVRDKQVAQQKRNEFVQELEREAAGIIAPRALREGAAKLMADHLSDFQADLRAKGRAAKYVYNVGRRMGTVIDECSWQFPRDVTPDSFIAWRSRQPEAVAAKTLNDYLDAANVLLNWMQRQGRLNANPLRVVGKVETAGKEKFERRALTDAEMTRLLGVAGPRKVTYLLAVLLGPRRGELTALQWGDVHLDAPSPFVTLWCGSTKNRKRAVMWLRDDVLAELRAIRPADVREDQLVLDGRMPTMDEWRADLNAAGIVYEIERSGRPKLRADFHALRHTLGTNLGRAGIQPRVAMEVMRHSDMKLTMRTYTDASQLPLADVADRLPR
jgi:integrase